MAAKNYGYEVVDNKDPGARENLLQINVYFKSLNVRTIDETPTYSVRFVSILLMYLYG